MSDRALDHVSSRTRIAGDFSLWIIFLFATSLSAEEVTYAGRIVDESGAPLAGARVEIEELSEDPRLCCGPIRVTTTSATGEFSFGLPQSEYVITADAGPPFDPSWQRVEEPDDEIEIVAGIHPWTYLPDDPPVLERMSLGAPNRSGIVELRGSAGAVPPNSFVIVQTLVTGHFAWTRADSTGSFSINVFGPAGAYLYVQADPYGLVWRRGMFEVHVGGEGSLSALPATMIHVPVEPREDGTAFGDVAISSDESFPVLWIEGIINETTLEPGTALTVEATAILESERISDDFGMEIDVALEAQMLSGPDGNPRLARSWFASTMTTPTGLAIEREALPGFMSHFSSGRHAMTDNGDGRGRVDIVQSWTVPEDLPPGWYRPRLELSFEGITPEPDTANILTGSDKLGVRREQEIWLPVVRIGDPSVPRVSWCLLTETAIDGSRGPCSIEDREHFAIAPRISTPSRPFVVPRFDPRSGEAHRYLLEPFAPSVSVGDRGIPPSPPLIPFRFPSGSLVVEIQKPDGSIERIGPQPFRQSRSRTLVSRSGQDIGRGGGHISSAFQLSTMDPAFGIEFDQEGPHTIRLDGWIEDDQGNVWRASGTYELVVGRLLDLEPAIFPGTPFEVGDAVTPSAVIRPGFPADVTWSIRLVPGTGGGVFETTLHGRANRFGHYRGDSILLDREGEYHIDIHVRHRDQEGTLWAGSQTWGGIVASPDTDVIAHGRRGVDSIAGIGPQWFIRDGEKVPSNAQGHMFVPFATGDVQWAEDRDAALAIITMEDPSRSVVDIVWPPESIAHFGGPEVEERILVGETPLTSTRTGHRDAYLEPENHPLWAYSYRSIQRPGVRVREQIGESGPSGYWRFNEQYDRQFGIGESGDLPNDIKFQFGGLVVRGPAIDKPRYAIYGSLFVLIPDSEQDPRLGSRVFPPFQGNGGGPSGGPLFTLKGDEIDIFFHPTGVRPGTILERGQRASFAGYSAPTLPSKVEIVVTSPSGKKRTITGQANKIGWFYDPRLDFRVDETGVWLARVKIWFDGITSAGQVTEPYPTGDVLGSREGEFFFYVVEPSSEPLELSPLPAQTVATSADLHSGRGARGEGRQSTQALATNTGLDSRIRADADGRTAPHPRPLSPDSDLWLKRNSAGGERGVFLRPADGPISFMIAPPEDLTDATFHYTVTMPGFILEEGAVSSALAARSSPLSYTYDAQTLAQDFPNLDLHDADGFAGVDTITMSFVITGRDASGVTRHFARQIVLQGEELQMPEQEPGPPRRRVVTRR